MYAIRVLFMAIKGLRAGSHHPSFMAENFSTSDRDTLLVGLGLLARNAAEAAPAAASASTAALVKDRANGDRQEVRGADSFASRRGRRST
jgi:hypothetical protein